MTDRHMSIDIETLDVEKDAAVIAIGAVIFTAKGIEDRFEVQIDAKLTPGSRDPDTWKWWLSQDEAIKTKMLSGDVTPWAACTRFAAFCSLDVDYFWGYPARFDCGHLRSLFRACSAPFPFEFYKERDLSTLIWLGRQDTSDLKTELKRIKETNIGAHDALNDAVVQAYQVMAIMRFYGVE